jgi:hypothetical protein
MLGDTTTYKAIMLGMMERVAQNYNLTLRQPVQYSEYAYIDSTKELLHAVYIEGVKFSIQEIDKHSQCTPCTPELIFTSHHWFAQQYFNEKSPLSEWQPLWMDKWENNILGRCFATKKEKKYVNMDDLLLFNFRRFDNEMSNVIGINFETVDTLYDGKPCYKLTGTYKYYGEKQSDQPNNMLQDSGEKNELLQKMDGKLRRVNREEFIIKKDDFALLRFYAEVLYTKKETGTLAVGRRNEEQFAKVGEFYQRTLSVFYSYYKPLDMRRYAVEQPLFPVPPLDSLKVVEAQTYDFCTPVAQPTAKMLEAWRKFIGK